MYIYIYTYTIKISKSFLRLRSLTSSPILYVYIMRIRIPFRSFRIYARTFPLEAASNLNDENKRFRLSYARTSTGTPLTRTRLTPRHKSAHFSACPNILKTYLPQLPFDWLDVTRMIKGK